MKQNILKQKINGLSSYDALKNESVKRFGTIIGGLDDWSLARINPIAFAQTHNFDEGESIDLFVHGAKIGLFDMEYNVLCPGCGGVAHSHQNLDQVQSDVFHCSPCNVDIETTLDDQVEASFTIHSQVKKIDLNTLGNMENYFRYYFSNNFEKTKEMRETYVEKMIKDYNSIQPDQKIQIDFNAENEDEIRLVSVERNSAVRIHIKAAGPDSFDGEIDLLPGGFAPSEIFLKPGKHTLTVANHSHLAAGFLTMKLDREIREFKATQGESCSINTRPFLTAKMLLNNQSFRELFRIQNLDSGLNLNVRSLTVMFTDLRGSTEMYDQAGDHRAYELVQEHFKILTEVVRDHQGAIVKTMGDAIMATFSSPLDGFLASLDMMSRIQQMNNQLTEQGYDIGLKIGINEGPALAVVNDERLDYFGQSINIAARVQGLAQAGEVWVSDSILGAPGVQDKLQAAGYKTEEHRATLKGVGTPTLVHKIFKSTAAVVGAA